MRYLSIFFVSTTKGDFMAAKSSNFNATFLCQDFGGKTNIVHHTPSLVVVVPKPEQWKF